MQNTYLPTVTWKALCAALVEAGEHPADPQAAIGIVLAEFGVYARIHVALITMDFEGS